eukprot:TRINITY_DN13021_c0_g1_i1.p2 TRINITY_DN13021_c0_g1~~TRINITY_DN13021_c0_g1_i1.p2  ORF type:complete len:102 (+),score=3.58 TRINITY_DN13021_c0_g1_i1:693-998(+)
MNGRGLHFFFMVSFFFFFFVFINDTCGPSRIRETAFPFEKMNEGKKPNLVFFLIHHFSSFTFFYVFISACYTKNCAPISFSFSMKKTNKPMMKVATKQARG